jgi:uncharacterized protein (TIGR00299 family) protein
MHIHLDLIGGLAGDMFIAAALDAQLVTPSELEEVFNKLGMGGQIRVLTQHVGRGALTGTHIDFDGWDPSNDSDHRHLSTIERMISDADLSEGLKMLATELFRTLGASESKIHGIDIESVHFHEVGAVDSILDFVGAAYILDKVNATWSFSDIPCGHGTIETAHGTIPVPAPAAADLMVGLPTVTRDIAAELVTPTGATLLRHMAKPKAISGLKIGGISGQKSLAPVKRTVQRSGTLVATGYGCGTKNFKEIANVVRMMVYEQAGSGPQADTVTRIECEIDDMNPEHLAWFCENRLTQVGAIDVSRTAVIMKKGRAGTRLTVLCRPENTDDVARAILTETSTFGVRTEEVSRIILERKFRTVETSYGQVKLKVGILEGVEVKAVPEFEDCARLAAEHDVPISVVYEAALKA